MTDHLAAWLAAREPQPPAGLARALRDALGDPPQELPEAAVESLRRALALGDDRAAAWELLTADALLTYAIERAAEQGSAELQALLSALDPAALAAATLPNGPDDTP